MNLRRGFQRLFVVFAVSWYLLGALYLYDAWSSHFSRQQFDLNRCLAAVRDSNRRQDNANSHKKYFDVNDKPIPESEIKLPAKYHDVNGKPIPESEMKPPAKYEDVNGKPIPESEMKPPKGYEGRSE